MSRKKKPEKRTVLLQDRRRFLGSAGAALAALGLCGDLAAASLSKPAMAVLGAQDPGDDGVCTTTITGTQVKSTSGGRKTKTETYSGPDGNGTASYTVTVTVVRGDWTATYSYTATGSWSAIGGTKTSSYTEPPGTSTLTWSKTKTYACTADPTTVDEAPPEEPLGFYGQARDIDSRDGLGRECRLA
jgi:hypothetical protein